MFKIVSNQLIKEIIVEFEKGILIARISTRGLMIHYKPAINYGDEFSVIGFPYMLDGNVSEVEVIETLKFVYEHYQEYINRTLYYIWNDRCPADVSEYFCMECGYLKEECKCNSRRWQMVVECRVVKKDIFRRLN